LGPGVRQKAKKISVFGFVEKLTGTRSAAPFTRRFKRCHPETSDTSMKLKNDVNKYKLDDSQTPSNLTDMSC